MHQKVLIAVAALLIIYVTPHATAEDAPLPVFLLAGQSNMAGHGFVKELPKEKLAAQPDVLFYAKDEWLPLEPGKVPAETKFGPEVSFGQAMAKHLGKTVGLIKSAQGGTDLAERWSPHNEGNMSFKSFVKKVKAAQKSRKIVIVGMIWMQGEADAKDEAMAKAYQKNLVTFIQTLRLEFGVADMPFVCGRINPVAAKYTSVPAVRAAQESVKMPGYLMIDCDNLSKGHDNIHYNAEGQLQLGELFAKGMISLLDSNKK